MTITIAVTSRVCPVQLQGLVDDQRFYFRARGCRWSFAIHPENPVRASMYGGGWRVKGDWNSDRVLAGWMPIPVARAIVLDCCRLWRLAQQQLAEYEATTSEHAT